METTDVAKTAGRSKIGGLLGVGALQGTQLDTLQSIVTKHIVDPSLTEIANTEDFALTSLERGIPRYEHPHLVAALDVLLMYQRDRRGNKGCMTMRRTYRHDPRTRLVELLKRWLRTSAPNADVSEDEVRRMGGLCRDVLNHARLFPSRNVRSFMQTIAEVYEHLQLQLREVLEHDRTCAQLAARALSISRNLIADAIAFLLLAATDLKQTDKLPSIEVVSLWQSLPASSHPLKSRQDPALQKCMKEAWETDCGSLMCALLCMPWAFRLFDGAGAQDEAAATRAKAIEDKASAKRRQPADIPPEEDMLKRIQKVREEFKKGHFSSSGLAGPFREEDSHGPREVYLSAVEAVADLMYFLGEVMVHFQRISDGLGDYGMIRVAPWLHPFLELVVEKIQRLRTNLETLNCEVDNRLVIAKARDRKVKPPVPTERMSQRAHASIERAVTGRDSHVQALLRAFEELSARSAPERLPGVVESLGDACTQLQQVISSPQFRARVGGAFPELPALGGGRAGGGASQPALPPPQVPRDRPKPIEID